MPTPAARTIRWGIIGAGAIAGRFARDLVHVPQARLAAVFARRPAAALELASPHGAVAVATLEDLFAAGVDAVYLATLPDTHHSFARAALEAGLPVLCEKPVTRSLAELDDLLSVAGARNVLFMEAMKTPFLPAYRALAQHLSEGDSPFGPISFVQSGNSSANTPPQHPSWRLDLAGGALMAIGVYQAFLAVDFLGPATTTQALGRLATAPAGQAAPPPSPAGAVDAFTLVQSRHRHGFSQLYAGLELASPGTAILSGPGGFITLHKPWWNCSRITGTPLSGSPIEFNHPVVGDGLHYETAHFCDLLRSGDRESPVVTHAHSRAVMQLLDAARAAIGLESLNLPETALPLV